LFDGVPEAVRRLNDAEYRVVVVTNQSVVARGECTIEELGRIHAKMETQLAAAGAFVDRIYFCPHHPDKGFPGEVESLKIKCECRKPGIGMIREAIAALNIDLQHSWLVGDASRDMLAAARAGVRSILVRTGDGSRDEKFEAEPDFIVDDFRAAVTFILDDYPRIAQAAQPPLDKIASGDVVLIGGLARVGKSSFAQVLASELRLGGKRVAVISLDRWIRDLEHRGPGVIERFDLDFVEETLRPWLAGDVSIDLELPRYDRLTRRRESQMDTLRLEHDSVLILEGVPALMLPLPIGRRIHRVFIAGAEEPRRERVISDLIWRGADRDDATATYMNRVRDESPVVIATRATADTVIDWDPPIVRNEARA
jgi:histidinol-phosphate phosphatase family protein